MTYAELKNACEALAPAGDARAQVTLRLLDALDALENREVLRRLELSDTDAALAEYREREVRARPDPRPWWETCTDTEGGYP